MEKVIKEAIQKYMKQFGNSDYDEDHFAAVVKDAVEEYLKRSWWQRFLERYEV